MKRIILIVSLITAFTVTATAQFRLNAYGAYTFDDGVKSYNSATNYYEGTVEGGFQWGIGAEYMIGENIGIDFKYLHQDSKAPFTYYNNGIKTKTFDLGINYYLFGGSYYFKLANEKIEPYLGGGIGWAGLNSNNDSLASGSSTKSAFAWNMKGGTNIWFGKKVGLKLQAELISAASATGGAYFWSYYGPIYATTYTSIYQFSLGGGLVFRFGK